MGNIFDRIQLSYYRFGSIKNSHYLWSIIGDTEYVCGYWGMPDYYLKTSITTVDGWTVIEESSDPVTGKKCQKIDLPFNVVMEYLAALAVQCADCNWYTEWFFGITHICIYKSVGNGMCYAYISRNEGIDDVYVRANDGVPCSMEARLIGYLDITTFFKELMTYQVQYHQLKNSKISKKSYIGRSPAGGEITLYDFLMDAVESFRFAVDNTNLGEFVCQSNKLIVIPGVYRSKRIRTRLLKFTEDVPDKYADEDGIGNYPVYGYYDISDT